MVTLTQLPLPGTEAAEASHVGLTDAPFAVAVDTAGLGAGLRALYEVQQVVSGRVPGCIPPRGQKPTREATVVYHTMLVHELHELLAELNFAPWKDEKAVDVARVADEFADVLAFLGVVVVHLQRLLELEPEQLADAYATKTAVNLLRLFGLVEGYRSNGAV